MVNQNKDAEIVVAISSSSCFRNASAPASHLIRIKARGC